MAAQHAGRPRTGHLPDGHHAIRAATGQPGAVRTPGDVEEGGRVALQDPHALPTLHVPQPQRAIVTATEQAAAVRREGPTIHPTGMPVPPLPRPPPLPTPHPTHAPTLAPHHPP